MTSVILLMVGAGLSIPFAQVVEIARRLQLLVRGLAVNFIVTPALIYLSIRWLPISPDVKIGIMLMAAAPVAPMAPPFVGMAKGDLTYSVGLMTIVALLSVPLTPLIISLAMPKSQGGVVVDPFQIIQTLLTVQLIPIIVGMVCRQIKPALADKLLGFVPRIGQIGLLVGVGLLLAAQAKQIISIELVAYLVMPLLVVAMLLAGDWMMIGQNPGLRRSLAVSTAIRNIPLAFLIANASFPGTAVAPVTLVFSVFTMVLSIIYAKMMVRSDA
jgi:BASS family bile acid:Na+ symporter